MTSASNLLRWSRRAKSAQFLALRSRIVVGRADRLNKQVAVKLGVALAAASKWPHGFVEAVIVAMLERTRRTHAHGLLHATTFTLPDRILRQYYVRTSGANPGSCACAQNKRRSAFLSSCILQGSGHRPQQKLHSLCYAVAIQCARGCARLGRSLTRGSHSVPTFQLKVGIRVSATPRATLAGIVAVAFSGQSDKGFSRRDD